MSVASIYEGWQKVQTRMTYTLPKLDPAALQLRSAEGRWPVWAIVSHLAGTRVYWLCHVFKEPGAETTPFGDPSGEGWEDHLDQPRTADELMFALGTTWRVVQSCLERWTPDMLEVIFPRRIGDVVQQHSRHSVLTRLVMHDSYHCGEVSLLLGQNGLPSMDPWEPIV